MTKKRKTALICSIALFVLCAVPVGAVIAQSAADARHRAYEQTLRANAETNAVRYIEEKYGFTPAVQRIELKRDGVLFDSEFTGRAHVKLQGGDRTFYAYIDAADTGADNYDNYQFQEMKAALLEKVSEQMPEGTVLDLDFYAGDDGAPGRTLHTKYDGSNLEQILSEVTQMHLQIGYVNADFTDCPQIPFLQAHEIYSQLYSFDSAEHCRQAEKAGMDFREKNYAPMITDAVYIRPEGNERYSLGVQTYGDLRILPDDTADRLFTVTEADSAGLLQSAQQMLPSWKITELMTKAYRVADGISSYYVYIPTAQIKDYSADSTYMAVQEIHTASDAKYCQTQDIRICGDYAVMQVSSAAELQFALFQYQEK